MHKHVLIATDGSAYALRAARYGLLLAKAAGAKITVITVTPPWHAISLSEVALGHDEKKYAAAIERYADGILDKVRQAANDIGVNCELVHLNHERAYEAIVDTALERGCDLIVVGAHGRRGVAKMILGSETVKLLNHSKLPVLVYRQ